MPSLPQCATHTGVLRANLPPHSPLLLDMKDCSTGETPEPLNAFRLSKAEVCSLLKIFQRHTSISWHGNV